MKTWITSALMLTALATPARAQQPAQVTRIDVLAPSFVRSIEMRNTVWMAELTAPEARDLIKSGKTTAIVCGGGVEENGPFVVMDKHNVECKAIAEPIARKLGNALVTPVLTIEPGDPEKSNTPGAPVVSQETYKALLTDIATNLRVQGFRNIVLLGDNGGNLRAMSEVSQALNAKWKGDGKMIFIEGYGSGGFPIPNPRTDFGCCSHNAAIVFQEDVLGIHEVYEGYHADYENTSVLTSVDPNNARIPERIKAKKTTTNGVELLPIEKTIANGKRIIEFRADQTTKEILRLIAAPPK
jgi:creatinine amidohydrolase